MTVTDPGPTVVPHLAAGLWGAKVLFAAVRLEVFQLLDERPADPAELCDRLGLHPRATGHFLLALAELGLLERDPAGRYAPAPVARRYLLAGGATDFTGFLQLTDRILNPSWDRLVELLRSGETQNTADRGGDPSAHLGDVERIDFLAAMDSFNEPVSAELAEWRWSAHRTFVDLGGSRGNLAANLVLAHPHLRATVLDLPRVEPAFHKHMADKGLTRGEVRFQPGDFFADELPAADVFILGHVLHDWSDAERRVLVRRAHDALPPGGTLLVYDQMIDESEPRLFNVLLSLNMMLRSHGGAEYGAGECESWFRAAGFAEVTRRELGETENTLVIGRKGN